MLVREFRMLQPLVWILFFFSGASGLIYEVLWCRHLGLVFGNTVHSLSAVLTAFMGGLALGSYVGGRACRRLKRPLLAYGVLEVFVGIYCAALPWLLSDHGPVVPLYRALYGEAGSAALPVARFVISSILLAIPTSCMGATLPVLSQYLVTSNQALGRTVGRLYAVNSFGAAAGAVAAGFLLLPELGKVESNWVAVAFNLTVGLFAIAFALRKEAPETNAANVSTNSVENAEAALKTEAAQANVTPAAMKACVMVFGVTGFAGMATQIGWTRAISLGTGSSTYAFSLIVAVFILGISFGGLWGSRAASRSPNPLGMLSIVLLMIGLYSMALAILLGFVPLMFFFIIAWGSSASWGVLLLMQALGIALLIIGPTFLMGATLPLTLQVASRSSTDTGRTTGSIYAVNTVGSIFGSFLGGLAILPLLGIQTTLNIMALLYAFSGALLFVLSGGSRKGKQTAAVAGLSLLLLFLTFASPRWDPLMMSSGMYLLREDKILKAAREFRFADALPNYESAFDMLYHKEGAAATVTVMRSKNSDNLSLRVGGKPDASSTGDMATQIGLTLIPELLHASGPENVLIIGLGSGVSAGAALSPASVKNVDVVEMSPEVVEASEFFKKVNHLDYAKGPNGPIATNRLHVVINDGRNHLLLSNRSYDVIASEPSNPWMAGVGNLFTKEAFQLAASRLKPGGVMCQWIHSYSLSEEQFFTIVKTFGEVFPEMQLWCVNRVDFLLIGSNRPIAIDPAKLRVRMEEPAVAIWLYKVNFEFTAELIACFLCGKDQLKAVTRASVLHTDDNMLLEFGAPRSLYLHGSGFRSTGFVADPETFVRSETLPAEDRSEFLEWLDLALASREHTYCSIDNLGVVQEHTRAVELLSRNYQESSPLKRKFWYGEVDQPAGPSGDSEIETSVLELLSGGKVELALAGIAQISPARRPKFQAYVQAYRTYLSKNYDKALAEVSAAANAGASPLECTELAARILRDSGHADDARATLEGVLSSSSAASDAATAPLWMLRAELLAKPEQQEYRVQSLRLAVSLLRRRTAGAALNIGFKCDLARTLLAAPPILPESQAVLAEEWRRYARRCSREITALAPDDARGWELLCRSFLALAKSSPSDSGFYQAGAANAYQQLLRLELKINAAIPGGLKDEINRIQKR